MTTATPPTLTRDQEIRQIWKDYRTFYRILGAVAILAIGIFIGAKLFSADSGYGVNLYTELLSIGVTVFILDYLNRRRDEQNATRQLQQQLIMDASSTSNEKAKDAIHQLRYRDWLKGENGLLQGMNLEYANLQKAAMLEANLQGTNLEYANLQKAEMQGANLQGADLEGANLRKAEMQGANLQGADLEGANLQGTYLFAAKLQGTYLFVAKLQEAKLLLANLQEAKLVRANLQGADLLFANLQGADLTDTIFDESTRLPDSTYWSSDVDMHLFTDPDHPNFWQPPQ